jgi:hypothetical protein
VTAVVQYPGRSFTKVQAVSELKIPERSIPVSQRGFFGRFSRLARWCGQPLASVGMPSNSAPRSTATSDALASLRRVCLRGGQRIQDVGEVLVHGDAV